MMRQSSDRSPRRFTTVEPPSTTVEATPEFVTDALRDGGMIDSGTAVVGGRARADRRGRRHRRPAGAAAAALRGPAAGAPGTVILKLPSQFPENRAVGDHFNFYEREGRFYQQLGDKLPMRIAALLLEPHRPGANSFGLLLEDLGRPHDDQPGRRRRPRAGRPGARRRSAAAARRVVGVAGARQPRRGCPASTTRSTSPPARSTATSWPHVRRAHRRRAPGRAPSSSASGPRRVRGPDARRRSPRRR